MPVTPMPVTPTPVGLSAAERPPAEDTTAREVRTAEPKVESRDEAPAVLSPSDTKASDKAPAPPANPLSPTSSLSPAAPDTVAFGTTPLRASAPVAAERRPIDPNLPPDHPLEPGVSRSRYPGSPTDRIAASEAALGLVKPPVIADPAGKSNFIAAARRAAQAATSEPPVRSFMRTSEAAAPKTSTTPTMFPSLSLIRKHARLLIIGASVLAIVLGSVHIAVNWLADEPEAGKRGQTATSPSYGAESVRSDPSAAPRASHEALPTLAAEAQSVARASAWLSTAE